VPNANEIVSGHLETIAILRRAVGSAKLNTTDTAAATDFLNGLAYAVSENPHSAYVISECSRELRNKAAAAAV
jgi:hypothetical protein